MSIELIDKIKPKNGGTFSLVDASDVEMPDGTRLSEQTIGMKIVEGSAEIQPDTYYVFGEVSELAVSLVTVDDGKAHEYCFEFIPTADFSGLTVTPEPTWANEPQFTDGKTCQVSILRGVAVMVCA